MSADARVAVGAVLAILVAWVYYTCFESSCTQASLGKTAMGLVVCDGDGEQISFSHANGRFWGKMLSVLTLGGGFIVAAFSERKQAMHDIMAKTWVVDRDKLPQAPTC